MTVGSVGRREGGRGWRGAGGKYEQNASYIPVGDRRRVLFIKIPNFKMK